MDNPYYSGVVNENEIVVRIPANQVPSDGHFYVYTDDGSHCDDVGIGLDGPIGQIPPGGPFVDFLPQAFLDLPPLVSLPDLPGGVFVCSTGEPAEDPGADIQ